MDDRLVDASTPPAAAEEREPLAHAERSRPRRDDRRATRAGRDAVRAEHRRPQPRRRTRTPPKRTFGGVCAFTPGRRTRCSNRSVPTGPARCDVQTEVEVDESDRSGCRRNVHRHRLLRHELGRRRDPQSLHDAGRSVARDRRGRDRDLRRERRRPGVRSIISCTARRRRPTPCSSTRARAPAW